MEKYSKNTLSSQLKSVVFFTNNGHDPCTFLRLRGPMRQLGIDVIDGKLNDRIYPMRVSRGVLVLIQRDSTRNRKTYDKVIELAHQENKPIDFDTDDLLLHLPETQTERQSQHYTEWLLPMLRACNG